MRKTILLVEDHAATRNLIKEVISSHYEVYAASSCSEARDVSSRRIDLALVDYRLPDGNGLDIDIDSQKK